MRLTFLIFMLIYLVGVCPSYSDEQYKLSPLDQHLVEKYKKDGSGYNSFWDEYIYKSLFFNMPEEEFVRIFTQTQDSEGTLKPYIIEHRGPVYYLYEPYYKFMKNEFGSSNLVNPGKARVVFQNGFLVKYEYQHWGKPPFVFLVYSDDTHSLRGYVDPKGFYDGMFENEFLMEFSNKILSHKRDKYVFWGKDGKKYRVTFYKGYLIGRERL